MSDDFEPQDAGGHQDTEVPNVVVSTATISNGNKISVTFERKLGYDGYSSATARAWVEGEVPKGADISTIAQNAGDLFAAAAAAVFDQLGIEYVMDDEGVLREAHKPIVSVSSATSRIESSMPGSTDVDQAGNTVIRVMNPNDQQGPLPQWAIDAMTRDGVTACWDQRKSATGNQPKFKEAVPRGGVGKGKDGQGKGYWEPK